MDVVTTKSASSGPSAAEGDEYRGLSCPHEKLDETFVSGLAATHFRRALRTFVSRHAWFLKEHGSAGVVDMCERFFDDPVLANDLETTWHLAFGKMRELLARETSGERDEQATLLAGARIG